MTCRTRINARWPARRRLANPTNVGIQRPSAGQGLPSTGPLEIAILAGWLLATAPFAFGVLP